MAIKKEQKENKKEVIKPASKLVARVTEKASAGIEKNIYTFNIPASFNKTEIKKEVFKVYKVKPVKVAVVPVHKKKITFRGKLGVRGGGKKALVYLKKGDKIEIV